MKARNHLATHLIILIIIMLILSFFLKYEILSIFNLATIIGLALYFLGAILPDADSNNKGSYIYHKGILSILAHMVSWLEYPIAKFITKRKIEHRESLHTIIGISITSFFVLILTSIIYQYIFKDISLIKIFFWYFSLFVGQLFHLLEDIEGTWKPTLL